ncbi:hypothetical protein, partial [Acidiphilium sp.]|uniref:hypothetical protein n=1 Tax=Acidiphilium sp. TaxID=527 RepID=UPI0025851F07
SVRTAIHSLTAEVSSPEIVAINLNFVDVCNSDTGAYLFGTKAGQGRGGRVNSRTPKTSVNLLGNLNRRNT